MLIRLVDQSVYVFQHAQLEADTVLATPATASWPNTASLIGLPRALFDREMPIRHRTAPFATRGQHKHLVLPLIPSIRRPRNPLFPTVGTV